MEWVSDCCLTPISNFSAISWREQVNFQWNDDEVCFVLDQHPKLDFYNSLKQQWDMSDTLFWFRAIQSLVFLLDDVCLAEKQQVPILKSLVWTDRGSNPPSSALKESTLTIMPPMRLGAMVFNATFNNISVISRRSVLLVEETGVPGENHRLDACHWTLSQCCIENTSAKWGSNLQS